MRRSVMPSIVSPRGIGPAIAFGSRQAARWRPGLAGASHSEVFASGDEGCGAALALALARDTLAAVATNPLSETDDRRMVLWVQDRDAIKRGGRPYLHGLPADLRHRLIHVEVKSPADALFALEEGLRCRDLAFVLGEIAGNPRALDFTSSRRLSLAAEKHGVPLWLVRLDARPDLSSARLRWQARSAVSPPARWNAHAPGIASWRAELFRARTHPPGTWTLRDDGGNLVAAGSPASETSGSPHHGDLVRAAGGRSLAAV